MFEMDGLALITAVATLAGASMTALVTLLPRLLPPAGDYDERWRDRAPLAFRLGSALTRRLRPLAASRLKPASREKLARRLDAAGLAYSVLPEEFIVVRWAGVTVSGLLVLVLAIGNGVVRLDVLAAMALLPLVARAYPDLWLAEEAKRRKLRIEREFPFFLDVLVLSMQAGLAFPAAVGQATRQLPPGPFRHEMSRLIREVRTGHGRNEALTRLAERVRIPAVSNFVAAVAQAEESGGALASSLCEQARQRRRERFARAEKLANQAPVKMLFPLVAFLFPVTFLILGFPMYEQMKGSGFF